MTVWPESRGGGLMHIPGGKNRQDSVVDWKVGGEKGGDLEVSS